MVSIYVSRILGLRASKEKMGHAYVLGAHTLPKVTGEPAETCL